MLFLCDPMRKHILLYCVEFSMSQRVPNVNAISCKRPCAFCGADNDCDPVVAIGNGPSLLGIDAASLTASRRFFSHIYLTRVTECGIILPRCLLMSRLFLQLSSPCLL